MPRDRRFSEGVSATGLEMEGSPFSADHTASISVKRLAGTIIKIVNIMRKKLKFPGIIFDKMEGMEISKLCVRIGLEILLN